ncbi:MAG: NusA-like transcription termination signal-binding factor [Aigarchaeota archaeon]|nr:NusA-like transcription termination signal-binding factor [Candidatus Pelearchaeum maunauluense]
MSEGIKLTEREMRYIQLFEAATGASVIDCVEDGDLLVFLVRQGDIGKALAKKGQRVKEIARLLKKRIKVIEFANDPTSFVKNALHPAEIIEPVRLTERADGRKIIVVNVNPRDKGIAIGRDGRTIDLARYLAKRHFDIDHIIVQ